LVDAGLTLGGEHRRHAALVVVGTREAQAVHHDQIILVGRQGLQDAAAPKGKAGFAARGAPVLVHRPVWGEEDQEALGPSGVGSGRLAQQACEGCGDERGQAKLQQSTTVQHVHGVSK